MANKKYKKITRTVGHRINEAGIDIAIKKQFYGTSKKECEEKYRNYLAEQKIGIEAKNQYFGIMADNWIYEFFINDNKLKASTKNLYINTWNKYLKPTDLYHMPLDKVTPSIIQRTYNQLSCATGPIKTIHKLMRKFFKYLDREGYCRDLSASLVIPSKEKKVEEKEIIVWSQEEIRKIFNSFDNAQPGFRLRFFIVLAYYTGARISEILALTYDDFTEDGIRINKQVIYLPTFDKNGKTKYSLGIDTPKSENSIRTLPLSSKIKMELALHRSWHKKEMLANNYRTNYIFTTDSGLFYDDNNVRRALDRYYKRIGVECKSPHTYRHTFGTNLCQSGVRIEVASSLLGHSDIRITAKYYVGVTYSEKLQAVMSLPEF